MSRFAFPPFCIPTPKPLIPKPPKMRRATSEERKLATQYLRTLAAWLTALARGVIDEVEKLS